MGQIRAIVRWDDPILHTGAELVTDFGSGLQELLADLVATNTAAQGAGLAAPQLGVNRAAFVYDCVDAGFRRHVGVVCNPALEEPRGRPKTPRSG